MEQSITSEIDSIDKEIEALQKRKSQLQKSATEDVDFINVDRLIKSANFQLADKLEKDYLSFTASKEGLIFEGDIFELRLYNAETRSNVIKLTVNTTNVAKFITRILANGVAIDHIVSVLGDSIIDESHMQDAIYVSTPDNALVTKVSLSNEAGRFDISIDDRLMSDDEKIIIVHDAHPNASMQVKGYGDMFVSFNYLRESVEYEDVYSVLKDADAAYASFTVSTY